MFALIWGPTLAAVSVILDNATDPGVVRRALDALLLAAKMAAYHQVGQAVGQWGRTRMTAAVAHHMSRSWAEALCGVGVSWGGRASISQCLSGPAPQLTRSPLPPD